jgi:YfiH family protein
VTSREGGVSRGPYTSLNLAAHVGDESAAVAENRRRVRAALALPGEPLWLSQVHGTAVVDADIDADADADAYAGDVGDRGAPPQADAAITRRPGRVLAVLVADCLPVLIAARDGSAIAVAHAGWRGLAAGVLETTLAALAMPAGALSAWLGPAIGQPHFEVGEEVRAAFCDRDARADSAFVRNARGRWQCDLAGLARRRLAALGISSVHGTAPCTYADAGRFFSHRREGVTGRLAALLWLAP